jgi:hypothetical protein
MNGQSIDRLLVRTVIVCTALVGIVAPMTIAAGHPGDASMAIPVCGRHCHEETEPDPPPPPPPPLPVGPGCPTCGL